MSYYCSSVETITITDHVLHLNCELVLGLETCDIVNKCLIESVSAGHKYDDGECLVCSGCTVH